jgi:YVTN family beta-propeller protein
MKNLRTVSRPMGTLVLNKEENMNPLCLWISTFAAVLLMLPGAKAQNAYVADGINSNTVSVIDSSSNTIVATATVGSAPGGVAVTPDGTRAYVANNHSNSVSVIDTSSNTVVATVAVGSAPGGVAMTPDGTRACVTNVLSNSVSLIDTSSNTVVATVTVGRFTVPQLVAIRPTVLFSAFSAKLDISSTGFDLKGTFTLGAGGTINPPTRPLTPRVGTYTVTVPAGSFEAGPKATFTFEGTINGVALQIRIAPLGGNSYSIQVDASGVDLTALTNPVTVTLTIGNNTGMTSVTADFE